MTQEIKLLRATMDGNTAAFEQIVKKYQSLICAITFSGTGRVDISEELAQETFLSAWKNLRQLTDLSGFRPWLCTIARNMLNSYYRKKKPLPLDPADMADLSDQNPTPSDNLITQEENLMLEQALMQIPAEYREPLVMFYRQEKSTKEVAIGLGLNESTVRTRLSRARQMLREEIAARLERTLERTAPGKTFTKTVMAGIGAGLAAGAAGTASAAAATTGAAGAGASTGIAAVMSTVTAKVITAAAVAAITVGGVFTYKHLSQPGPQPTQPDEIAVVQEEKEPIVTSEQSTSDTVVVEPVEEESSDNQVTHTEPSGQEPELETQDTVMVSSRHPEWPGLNEPVNNIYIKYNDGSQMQRWIRFPRKHRSEDMEIIYIDNSENRIKVRKTDGTVQYSYAVEKPLFRDGNICDLERYTEYIYSFGRSQNRNSDSNVESQYPKYNAKPITQEDSGALLVYEIHKPGDENSRLQKLAYVDTATRLPEKIQFFESDPNSPENKLLIYEWHYDFSPIPDSIFEYTANADQEVLPYNERPSIIAGYVTDKEGNTIANAQLTATFNVYWKDDDSFHFSGSRCNWKFSTVSDTEGYYEIRNLPAFWKSAKYTIYCNAEGYVSEQKEVNLKESLDFITYDIALNPELVTVRGILRDNYGIPLTGKPVLLSAPKVVINGCDGQTDPNGFFEIRGCPDIPGLRVMADLSFPPANYPLIDTKKLESYICYPVVSQKIPYLAGQSEYFIEMTVIRPETTVEVFVTNSAGNPLPDFKVKVDGFMENNENWPEKPIPSFWSQVKLEKRTDSEGRILFDNVPDLSGMKLVVSPNLNFTREIHALSGKFKERQRLDKIDKTYSNKYQDMEIPVELVEGQTGYFIEAVVLTKEEFNSLPDENQ